jgi:hypothetical protein
MSEAESEGSTTASDRSPFLAQPVSEQKGETLAGFDKVLGHNEEPFGIRQRFWLLLAILCGLMTWWLVLTHKQSHWV